jgi:predicted chitinase
MTNNVKYYLQAKEKTRSNRLAKAKTREQKTVRLKRTHDQLQADTRIATKERQKRDGSYKSGQNMQGDDGYPGEDPAQQSNNNKCQKKPPSICKSCNQPGHATSKNKKCINYKGQQATCRPTAPTATTLTDDDNLRECNRYDAEPLVNVPGQLDTDEEIEALRAFMLTGDT